MSAIYLAYFKADNTLFGKVDEIDIPKFKKMGMNFYKTTSDKWVEDSKKFKAIPVSTKPAKTIINKPVPQAKGFNYELIPSKANDAIKAAYEGDDYAKMKEFRLKYQVADQCPTCSGAAKGYEKRIWQHYFENVLKE